MDKDAIDFYSQKVSHMLLINETNRLLKLPGGTNKLRKEREEKVQEAKDWFENKIIQTIEENNQFDFVRTSAEKAYEKELKWKQYISTSEFRLHQKKKELNSYLSFLEDEIIEARKSLKEGNLFRLNSFGLFQGNAQRADVLIAEIHLLNEFIERGNEQ